MVDFETADFETAKSNSKVSKSNLWKIIYFSKTTLPEKAISHNIINLSPLLVTK